MKYSQVVSPKSISPGIGFALVLGAVFGTWLIGNVCQAVGNMFGFPYGSYFAVLPLFFVAKYIMDNHLREYHYTVSDGQLYIERVLGQRTKVVLNASLEDIMALAHGDTRKAWLRCVVKRSPAQVFSMQFVKSGKTETVVFQPDKTLRGMLTHE